VWKGFHCSWWDFFTLIGKAACETVYINNIYEFSPYLTGNTLRHHYKAQPVNAVWETAAVFCENHTEHTDTLRGQNKFRPGYRLS
jgi:hypothetical protein